MVVLFYVIVVTAGSIQKFPVKM